ncbi:hypothetical protein REPUB_Repub16aG0123400 [Reevesia pubescens]
MAGDFIQKQLDRAICNPLWRHLFYEAFLRNLPEVYSENCAILLKLHRTPCTNRTLKPFHFKATWLTHDSFSNLIKEQWGCNGDLTRNLDAFILAIKEWNHNVFGNVFHRKKKLCWLGWVAFRKSLRLVQIRSFSSLEKSYWLSMTKYFPMKNFSGIKNLDHNW